MLSTLIPSLILASAGMFAVGSMMLVILLLMSEGGWHNGLSYVLGYVGGYTLIGVSVVQAGYRATGEHGGESSILPEVLLILLGMLLVGLALRNWRAPARTDGETPRFFTIVDRITPVRALGLGALVTVVNIKNLALFLTALSVVILSSLPPAQKIIITLLDVFVFCSTVMLPVVIYLVFPHRAEDALNAIKNALESHRRQISIWAPLLFGLLFIIKGVISLV